MTKKPAKQKRSDDPAGPRVLVLFGLDENKKPRAARFTGDELGLLAKAAEAMNLTVCDVNSPQLTEIAEKLPSGRLYASGRGFVPHVTKEVYGKLVEAAGSDASADPPTPCPLRPCRAALRRLSQVISSWRRRVSSTAGGRRSCWNVPRTCSPFDTATIRSCRSSSGIAVQWP